MDGNIRHPRDPLWQFWVDRGGTFTDIVALTPGGELVTRKLLSENPAHYADAAIEGIRRLQAAHPEYSSAISHIRMGTTVATNALLERKGEATVLLISKGLRDQLQIGYQTRPDIFAVQIDLPQPLYDLVYEVPERILADGRIDYPLDEEAVVVQLHEARELGFTAVAVALMHASRFPQHEQRIGELARAMGFSQISLSHEVSPLVKLVPRGQTTVADAYLSPVLRRYVGQVQAALSARHPDNQPQLEFMQSNGGLVDAADFQGRDAVLSGPAGGVVGMSQTAQTDGFDQVIGFDMGGTSTDVSHFAGELERETETLVNGQRLRVPMMNIHTVAAGGGSVVRFEDGRLQVGPESAGAFPGPACYRNGGPLTITDCNLLLGRIQASHFPAVFGPQQNQRPDTGGVRAAFVQLADDVSAATGQHWTPERLARGFLDVAIGNMAAAVKKVSVQRGYDVQEYVLNAFGGAGGQHACALADALGMQRIYLHPMAGVLSAYGIGIARQRWLGEAALECPLKGAAQKVTRAALALQETSPVAGEMTLRVYLRYEGSDTPLLVDWQDEAQARAGFLRQHQALFGFVHPHKPLLLDALQLEIVSPGTEAPPATLPAETRCTEHETVPVFFADWQETPVIQRHELAAGFSAHGPLLISDDSSTHLIEPGWRLEVLNSGALLLSRYPEHEQPSQASKALSGPDPVRLEIFNNLFMSVAEQMGFVLEKTASSVNIKERLDFSCALFDGAGELVANAPHIPVHLGSMSESIQVVMRGHPDMKPGDAYVLNTPYNGGTHLPDITVVRPVFLHGEESARFYVAARGHHADIGGISPGSMPSRSGHIDEEGVLLDNLVLVREGQFQEQDIRERLAMARYPARNPDQNIADLMAQLAACEKGAAELQRLCERYGAETVQAYMAYVQDNAEQTLRACLATLPEGQVSSEMDDGSRFCLSLSRDPDTGNAVLDFSGTGYRPDQPMHPGNFNAPESVVKAAVLYAFRVLVQKPMPLNAGFFRALTLRIPSPSMISPVWPAAVVSGNVETAQSLVDTLMAALQLMAGSQGTNNNFTFGNAQYQYYETLCGGAGASASGPGASAVHTHMTNSRLTDPEILEQRYPVVLDRFHIRQLSGGTGHHTGGNGVERHLRFLMPMTANIISGHRQQAPQGLNGGGPGQTGVNFVFRADGRCEWLDGCAEVEMGAGDTFCVHTPGGGGWGLDTQS
ncbi:MAG: 5-oxoprolinase [Oceanospirillaceae bacterium]|nr:5-oxoprolinase [Oceanospirillaceae bacterium]|tara:strand:- start:42129 stop:45746 length:3618 start_codon:yes stop_codon:yes gene_type:complete